MQEIRINDELERIDIDTEKARIISIKDGCLLTCIYDGIYMLPGGKIDPGETNVEGCLREIKEETGNNLTSKDLTPYLRVINNQRDYPSRDYQRRDNKRITTTYYTLKTPITVHKSLLSDKEARASFELKYIDIQLLITELENANTEKEQIFATELLHVLRKYIKDHTYIDLHTHTLYSDGMYEPKEVIERAIASNVRALAITDHDTVLGLSKIAYDKYKQIMVIPGVEISVHVEKGRMHILGLDIDYHNPELRNFLNTMHDNNIHNFLNIIDYLESIGISFAKKDIEEITSRSSNIGRPDIAKLMIKEGIVKDVNEAFKRYLIKAYDMVRDKHLGFNYEEVINIIKKSGGIPILAHPNSLELPPLEFESLLKDMIKKGLMGLEVYHPNMSDDERKFYMELVDKYHLLYSAGSDFHGEDVKPDITIAGGRNNLYIHDASVLSYIKKRHH